MKTDCFKTVFRAGLMLLSIAAAFSFKSSASAQSTQTVTFAEVRINSQTSVTDSSPDFLRDVTGANAELGPISGTNNLAFGNTGTGNYVVKKVADSVFARASLSNATLKTSAFLQFGSNSFVSGTGVSLGSRNGGASGIASFADSFRTYSGNTPFLWSSGTTATFHFDVTGLITTTGTIPDPMTYSAPQPIDVIYSVLQVYVFKPGTIDLLRQAEDFDFSAYTNFNDALAVFELIENQITANSITNNYAFFGQVTANFAVDATKILPLNPNAPTPFDFTFTPGGDFDWMATVTTLTFLDASLENVSVNLNFANSMVSSYHGPAGTTTFSGSGLYPSTLPLSEIPPPSTGKCPQPQGYWKNNPASWPVNSLTLGSQTYSKTELLKILGAPGGSDAGQILAVQVIATKLNLANGSDPAPISATVTHADSLLAGFSGKLPYKVKPSTASGKAMTSDGITLESYNKQLLTPGCTP
jgi:hypothetical protein